MSLLKEVITSTMSSRHGFINGWFNPENKQCAATYYILTEQIGKQKLFTMLVTVQILSGGQGFLNCSCKSVCQTR